MMDTNTKANNLKSFYNGDLKINKKPHPSQGAPLQEVFPDLPHSDHSQLLCSLAALGYIYGLLCYPPDLRQNIKFPKNFPSSHWPCPASPREERWGEVASLFKAPPPTYTRTAAITSLMTLFIYHLDTTIPSESGSPVYSLICKILRHCQLSSVWQPITLKCHSQNNYSPSAFHIKNSVTCTQARTSPSRSSQPSTENAVAVRIHFSSSQKPPVQGYYYARFRVGAREAYRRGDVDKATQLGGRGWVFNSDIHSNSRTQVVTMTPSLPLRALTLKEREREPQVRKDPERDTGL